MKTSPLSAQGEELQKQVQRHLGRCLMRIQQFELIAKALAVHADLAGPAPELAAIQSKRIDKASTASLGTLVKGEGTAFTNLRNLCSADDQEADALDETPKTRSASHFVTAEHCPPRPRQRSCGRWTHSSPYVTAWCTTSWKTLTFFRKRAAHKHFSTC